MRSVREFGRDILSARGWPFWLAVFFAGGAVIVLRRPDALFGAQFWAEDGAYWFADAYHYGLISTLARPSAGYFQTLARLGGSLSTFIPFLYAPLVMNLIAIVVQVLPAWLLLTSRFKSAVSDDRVRLLIAVLYLLLPNTAETHANLTNAQWYLALLAFMVLVAGKARSRIWKGFDFGVLALCAVSGPFAVFLLPVAFIRWHHERSPHFRTMLAIMSAGVLIQGISFFFLAPGGRAGILPDMSLTAFSALLGKQIFLGSVLGAGGTATLVGMAAGAWILHVAFAAGATLCVYAFLRGPGALRSFIVVAALITAAGLASPMLGDARYPADLVLMKKAWTVLYNVASGPRYWLFGIIAFVITLLWSVGRSRPRAIRGLASLFLAVIGIGIVLDFRDPPYRDMNFPEHAERFRQAETGETAVIPLNPPGWSMELHKK